LVRMLNYFFICCSAVTFVQLKDSDIDQISYISIRQMGLYTPFAVLYAKRGLCATCCTCA